MPSSGSAIVFISRIRSDLLFAVRKYRDEGLGGMRVWGLAASGGQARSCESGRTSCTAAPKGVHSLAKEHTLVPVCRGLRCWARMKRVKNLYARLEPGPRILMLCPKRYCSSALAAGSV